MNTGRTSGGKKDKCKAWLISALLPEGIRWNLSRKGVFKWERTSWCQNPKLHTDIRSGRHAPCTTQNWRRTSETSWSITTRAKIQYMHNTVCQEIFHDALSLMVQHVFKASMWVREGGGGKGWRGTCVCASRSGVALLVALAAPQLH